MSEFNNRRKLEEPIKSAGKEIQMIIKRVLKLEKENLYLEKPRIKDDIVGIIKEEIR